jgi:hypothetical protein
MALRRGAQKARHDARILFQQPAKVGHHLSGPPSSNSSVEKSREIFFRRTAGGRACADACGNLGEALTRGARA